MKSVVGLLALLACGCAGTLHTAGADGAREANTTVSVRNLHGEAMDVYALCGEHDSVRLGTVAARGIADFAPARSDMICATGLRFVMVPQGQTTGGYVTEPLGMSPRHIDLLIEKYPALSYWRVR